MDSGPSTHLWIGAFAGRLLQLQPTLSAASAINCAVENFHRRDEFEPHTAAERTAKGSWTGRKSDDAKATEPHSARYQQIFGTADSAQDR